MSTRHSRFHHPDLSQLSPLPAEPRCDVGDAHPHSPGKKTFHLKLKLKSGSTFTVVTYPYAIKNQRKARNAPSRGHFVPKPLVGGFGCLELVLYVIRELA